MGEKKKSQLMQSLYAACYGGSMAQLWPLKNWLYQTCLNGKKIPGSLPLLQKPRVLQSASPLSL